MAKAQKATDIDKDLQALVELQEKFNMHAGLQHMVTQQLQRAKVLQRRTELTLQELSQLYSDVPVYQQVGKAYFLAPVKQVVDELKAEAKGSEDEVKRLTQQQQHAAKALAATETELKEMFRSHPELSRQLAAGASG